MPWWHLIRHLCPHYSGGSSSPPNVYISQLKSCRSSGLLAHTPSHDKACVRLSLLRRRATGKLHPRFHLCSILPLASSSIITYTSYISGLTSRTSSHRRTPSPSPTTSWCPGTATAPLLPLPLPRPKPCRAAAAVQRPAPVQAAVQLAVQLAAVRKSRVM